jgi:hypothetical protein
VIESGGVVPIACPVSYAVDMTTKGTPGRVIRVDSETWTAYEQACKDLGTTRADDLRRHIHRQITAWKKRQRDAGAARTIAES